MSSTVGPPALVADVVVVAALWIAVTRKGIAPAMRAFLSGLTCLFAWAISLVLEALRSPVWLMAVTGVVILLSLAAVIATVHVATRPDEGETPSDGRNDPVSAGPEGPEHGGDSGEPTWWPEFERQFAAYVRQSERRERPARRAQNPYRGSVHERG